MNKKSNIELEALVELILIAFVFISLLYAENKFLSVQNVDASKEAKRLALLGEALQTVPVDMTLNYKELNYSMSMASGTVALKSSSVKSTQEFTTPSDSFTYSCSVELLKKKEGSKDVYVRPSVVFDKTESKITCSNAGTVDAATVDASTVDTGNSGTGDGGITG